MQGKGALAVTVAMLLAGGAAAVYAVQVYQHEAERDRQVALQIKQAEEQTRREQSARDEKEHDKSRAADLERAKLKAQLETAIRAHEAALAAEQARVEVEKAKAQAQAEIAIKTREVALATEQVRATSAAEQRQLEAERQDKLEQQRRRDKEEAEARKRNEQQARDEQVLYETMRLMDAALSKHREIQLSRRECEAQMTKLESEIRALRNITAGCQKEATRLQTDLSNMKRGRNAANAAEGTTFVYDNREAAAGLQGRYDLVARELQRTKLDLQQREQTMRELTNRIQQADKETEKVEAQLAQFYERPEIRKSGLRPAAR